MKIGIFNEYKGFRGTIEYSFEDNIHFGVVKDIGDLVLYEANTITELEKEFHKAVDDYWSFKEEELEWKQIQSLK